MDAVRYADVALVGVVAALLVLLVVVRLRTQRRRARLAAARERFEAVIAELLVSEEGVDAPAALGALDQRALLDAGLAALLELRGRERERVGVLLEQAGLVAAEAETLRSGKTARRRHAADALGLIATPGAREPLRAALQDPDVLVRLAAARGLAELGDHDGLLAATAVTDDAAEQHPGAVTEVALALGARAPVRLGTLYAASGSAEVRRIVVATIGELRLGEHVALLREALAGEDELAARAARGLGMIGDLESTDTLLAVVADAGRSWFVRVAASTALGQLGDPRAIEPLTAELTADEWPRRRAAAEALALLGPGGHAVLEEAAAAPDIETGRHAAAALNR